MRKEYIWEIKAHNTPLLKRSCSHCDSDRFYCSEKFRMNAQKKIQAPNPSIRNCFIDFRKTTGS